MKSIEPRIVRAFTRNGAGGNPAGVVLDADDLTAADKQRIATDLGLPETAFVMRSARATRRVEFFTPTRQIAHCGHATVAAFGLLHARGELGEGDFVKESIEGPRTVRIAGGQIFLRLPEPRALPTELDRRTLADALGLAPRDLAVAGHGISIAGNRFLQIRVRDAVALRAIAPAFDAIRDLSEREDLIGVYAYTPDTDEPEHVARARMFAPRYGIPEEAATGVGAGGLATLLAARHELPGDRGAIAQGDSMSPASPSLLHVRMERVDGGPTAVWVGGSVGVD